MKYMPTQFWHVLLPALLVGCAAPAPPLKPDYSLIDDTLNAGIQDNRKFTEANVPPAPISNALLPTIQVNMPGQSNVEVEPRFDLKVDRVNAREFFMGLVEGTPYNMVVHPKVGGQITLDLKNVSVTEVMAVVRDVYGFDYEQTATAYHVFPDEIRTRIYNLDYLAIKRHGSSNVSVSSGQVTGQSSDNNNNSNNSDNQSNRQTVQSSSIETESISDFWVELRQSLTAMVGNDNGRSVVVSPQSGVIVVRAMPEELRAVNHYLRRSETIMHRQVILEAKVLEVDLADGFQSGINWAALGTSDDSSVLLGQTGGGSIFSSNDNTSIINGNTGNLNPAALQPVDGTEVSAFGGMFTAMLNISSNFAAFIELLKSQGEVQVLSSPQVSAMNNQKAVIKVGTDKYYITDINSDTNATTGLVNTQSNVELTPFFSGVSLDVIPQISGEDDVTLHIHPTVVDVEEEIREVSTSAGEKSISVPLAVSTVRESDTVIRAKSGQVVIIGGLMKNKLTNRNSSVPFLGDLPLVGGLFRHTKELTVKSELIILLKPIVVNSGQQWAQGIQRSRERFNAIRRRPAATETN